MRGLIAICVGVPLFAVGLIAFLRSLYGDEVFDLGSPPQDLNRDDDYRLTKTRLNHPPDSSRAEPER